MTFKDIFSLRNTPAFTTRVHGAICAVCYDIVQPEAPTSTTRQDFAKAALKAPESFAAQVTHYVLVDNLGLSVDDVLNVATDEQYKLAVAEAVDKLIGLPDAA